MSRSSPATGVRGEWLGRLDELAEPGASILIAEAQAPHDPVRLLAWAIWPDRNPVLVDDVRLPRQGDDHLVARLVAQAGQALRRDVREAGCDAWAQGPPTHVWTKGGRFRLFREGRHVASISPWRMLTLARANGDAYVKLAAIEAIEVWRDEDGMGVRTVLRDTSTRTVAWWPSSRAAALGPLEASAELAPATDLARTIARAASVEFRIRDAAH